MFIEQIDIYKELKCISLSTEDGFSICSVSSVEQSYDDDQMSAFTTSLASLSNSVSVQLFNSELINNVIETSNGDLLIYKCFYGTSKAVLCVITEKGSNHGKTRFISTSIKNSISSLTDYQI